MTPTPQTLQQITRALRKVAQKFPPDAAAVLTDIHIQVKPESGELITYNDDDEELNRCVVEQWIGCSDDLYDEAVEQIRQCIEQIRKEVVDKMSLTRPFSFVLLNDDHETMGDIYLVDDDEVIVPTRLLEGLDEDLNAFLDKLMS